MSKLLKLLIEEFGLDPSSALSKLDKDLIDKKLTRAVDNDDIDTVTIGLETDDNRIVKVYVRVEDADAFEKELSELLGKEDVIENALNELSKKFDIIDVEWPADEEEESEEDINLDGDEAELETDGSESLNVEVYGKTATDDTQGHLVKQESKLTYGQKLTQKLLGEQKQSFTAKQKRDIRSIARGMDIDDSSIDPETLEKLQAHFMDSGEMPYGVMKARTGDPYQWMSNKLGEMSDKQLKTMLGEEVIAEKQKPDAEHLADRTKIGALDKLLRRPIEKMIYQAILDLGIPDEALNKSAMRQQIVLAIRQNANEIQRNSRKRQALAWFIDRIEVANAAAHKDDKEDVAESLLNEESGYDEVVEFIQEMIKFFDPTSDKSNALRVLESPTFKQYMIRTKASMIQKSVSSLRVRLAAAKKVMDTVSSKSMPNTQSPDISTMALEGKQEYKSGDKVKMRPDYADKDPDEIFTLSDVDCESKKARVSDKQGRGWNVRFSQIMPAKFKGNVSKLDEGADDEGEMDAPDHDVEIADSTKSEKKFDDTKFVDKGAWSIEKGDDGVNIVCKNKNDRKLVDITIDLEAAEKLQKAFTNNEVVVLRDMIHAKTRWAFSPRRGHFSINKVGAPKDAAQILSDKDITKFQDAMMGTGRKKVKEAKEDNLLNGWSVKDMSYTTKGADPTMVCKYDLTKGSKKIIASEFFGDWTIQVGSMDKRGLSVKAADEILKSHGAPSLRKIEDFVEDKKPDYSQDPMGGPGRYESQEISEAKASTNIGGYDVEIDGSQCFVIKGNFSASLEALMAMGELTNSDEIHKVPKRTLDKIEAWAKKNGYSD